MCVLQQNIWVISLTMKWVMMMMMMIICIGNIVYAQANMMVRKFYTCSDQIMKDLFREYCTYFYTAPLWVKFKKESLCKLQVAYNDCMDPAGGKNKMEQCKWSVLFKASVQSFTTLMRNLMYEFICRLGDLHNDTIMSNPIL